MLPEFAHRIIVTLHAAGFAAYAVGGCVRDLLLGMEPKDWDITTGARPEQVVALFPGSHLVGAQFGVVIVHEGTNQVEVATFRSDREYDDGRRPTAVSFETDPRKDVVRRDFTINALLLDPAADRILDFVNGQADLRAGIVRAIGDPGTRFREDHLRLLRAVRFAARLDFQIEETTLRAIRELAPLVRKVSAERVRDELSRILTEGHPRRGLELLDETGLLSEILPEISALKGVAQPPGFHPEGDVWTHTLMMLDGLQDPSVTLALGVLLHDVGKPGTFRVADRIRFDGHADLGERMAREILNRLRYSNEEIDQVTQLVGNHMRFIDASRMRESTLKKFMRLPQFDEHLSLHRLDCLASHGHLETYEMVRRKRAETPPELLKPAPLITGRDLIAAGYTPGPAFSRVLEAVEDAQLDNRIRTRDEALTLACELLSDRDPLPDPSVDTAHSGTENPEIH